MKEDQKLRCFIRKLRTGEWYSHCIDLCLDTKDKDYWTARRKLVSEIIEYWEIKTRNSTNSQIELRSSPWTFHLTYWKIWILNPPSHLLGRRTTTFIHHLPPINYKPPPFSPSVLL